MRTVPEYFGSLVFDDRAMRSMLPSEVYASLKKTIDEGSTLDTHVADAVAAAMRDWAVAHGATHFTTGSSPSMESRRKSTIASSPPPRMAALSWSFPARS